MAQMPKKIEMATKEAPRERIPSIRKPQIRRSVSFDYVQDSLTPEVRYFQYHFKGSPEGSSDQEFRSSILCDVIENS